MNQTDFLCVPAAVPTFSICTRRCAEGYLLLRQAIAIVPSPAELNNLWAPGNGSTWRFVDFGAGGEYVWGNDSAAEFRIRWVEGRMVEMFRFECEPCDLTRA